MELQGHAVAEMPGRVPLREQNRRRTRRVLLDAALEVFDEKGFGGATVEAIAARAGASKVTLYSYFPAGRDDLFRTLYEEINEEVLDRATIEHREASGLVGQVLALTRPLLDIGARPLIGRFYSNSDPTMEPALAPVRGHASRAVVRLLTDDITEARAAGTMASEVDPGVLAELLVGATRAALRQVAQEPNLSQDLLAGVAALVRGLLRAA
ncbi:helix-turn-helix domain-containing protein [Klenkia sp. LSe6-5]|uniref:Helix-turn-helix domain-containing protein n=1 Tax=Klenkia sesuvii TaxID=3103137 RepID=A0ABU8DQT9_9ACTN